MNFLPDYKIDVESIFDLIKAIPKIRIRLLSFISKDAKDILRHDFLSGQEIQLRSTKKGLISYGPKNRTAKKYVLRAYPVNLFENGRRLRSGEREPGRDIFKAKLPPRVQSRLGDRIRAFEKILEQELSD
ncbi:hypothetical protein [Spirochaeta cellobiosiphila]|uniref:hypothetical protein n=1 Tax=Spirochaeta cellobiosiphila TaxID=504483 RepID=UPI00041B8444|nr:hypothetical protein [Spirochaeta cellobiosiphila]